MKNFFSSIFSAKKENASPDELSLSDMMSFLETKIFPCSECGHFFQLDQPPPLTIAECSKCGAGNFVPRKVGPFWLYRFCADGGVGRVYKATCSLVPETEYCVKILHPQHRNDPQKMEELRREAQITAIFNDHPNSLTVVECDRDNDIVYMTSEYIQGLTLAQHIEKHGPLTEKETVNYALQLLDIIEFVYSKGYLYRDLKPQNIMLSNDKNLILLDYGLALPKGTAAHLDNEDVDGSPHFIPPERLTGQGEDIRSEIYSIGMVIYFMLSGKTYFKGDTLQEIAEQHVNADRKENLVAELPKINEDLVKLIERTTIISKRKRVQTLSEVQGVLHYIWKQYMNKNKKSASA